jgi:hypothetical protein
MEYNNEYKCGINYARDLEPAQKDSSGIGPSYIVKAVEAQFGRIEQKNELEKKVAEAAKLI